MDWVTAALALLHDAAKWFEANVNALVVRYAGPMFVPFVWWLIACTCVLAVVWYVYRRSY